MHSIGGWPILAIFGGAVASAPLLIDSRYRGVIGWVVVPILFGGAILSMIYFHVG